MAGDIAFVSANLGGIDPPFALPPRLRGVEAFYFTDQPQAPGWSTIAVPTTDDPRMAAKSYKCQIHRLAQVAGFRWLAWADSSFTFTSLDFLPQWAELAGAAGAHGVFIPHPDRPTVAAEYAYILGLLAAGSAYLAQRYSAAELARERDHFAAAHDLTRLRMWSGGLWLIANAPRVHAFLDAWWSVVRSFSRLDQAALAPLFVEHGVEVLAAPDVNLYASRYWQRYPHR